MKIEYLGHSCFRLTAKNLTSVVTDPYTKVGYELPSGLTADIVTISHSHFDHAYTQAVSSPYVVDGTDKRTVQGVTIQGVKSWHDEKQGSLRGENIIYKITMDGISVCHCGDLGEEVTQPLIDKIGKVDILLIPIGGRYTINARQAKAYIEKIAPKIAIPMHYKGLDCALDIADEKDFLALFDNVIYAKDNAIVVDNFTNETTQIVFMERK